MAETIEIPNEPYGKLSCDDVPQTPATPDPLKAFTDPTVPWKVATGLLSLMLLCGSIFAAGHYTREVHPTCSAPDGINGTTCATAACVAQLNSLDPFGLHYTGMARAHKSGVEVFSEAAGWADRRFDARMARDGGFHMASNSKLFVAVALYQLQERGVLNISDSVGRHLTASDFALMGHPEITEWRPMLLGSNGSRSSPPTIEQLLSMSSGMIDVINCAYPPDSEGAKYCWNFLKTQTPQTGRVTTAGLQMIDGYFGYNLATLVGGFITNPLMSVPGSRFHYTNVNFILASYLVEKYTRLSLGDYLRVNVFTPLGMNATSLPFLSNNAGSKSSQFHKLVTPNTDVFSLNKEGHWVYVDSFSYPLSAASGAISGSGGMISSTADMVAAYSSLFSKSPRVLTVASVLRMLRPRILDTDLSNRIPGLKRDIYYAQGVYVTKHANTSDSLGDTSSGSLGWPPHILYQGVLPGTTSGMMHASPPSGVVAASFVTTKMGISSAAGFRDLEQWFVNVSLGVGDSTKPPAYQLWYDGGGAGLWSVVKLAAQFETQ